MNSLLDSRRFQLEQIEIVLNRLKAPDAGSASRQVLTADLGERLAAAQGKNTFPFLSLLDVRELALENLKTGAEASLPDQIARAVKLFEQLRNKLLEARPSLR